MGFRLLDSKTMKERDDLILKLVEQGVLYKNIGCQVRLGEAGVADVVRKRRKKNGRAVIRKGGKYAQN